MYIQLEEIYSMSEAAKSLVKSIRLKAFWKKIHLLLIILGLLAVDVLLVIRIFTNHGSLI